MLNLKNLPNNRIENGVIIFQEPCKLGLPEVRALHIESDCIIIADRKSTHMNDLGELWVYAIACSKHDNPSLLDLFSTLPRDKYNLFSHEIICPSSLDMTPFLEVKECASDYLIQTSMEERFIDSGFIVPEYEIVSGVIIFNEPFRVDTVKWAIISMDCDSILLETDNYRLKSLVLDVANTPNNNPKVHSTFEFINRNGGFLLQHNLSSLSYYTS